MTGHTTDTAAHEQLLANMQDLATLPAVTMFTPNKIMSAVNELIRVSRENESKTATYNKEKDDDDHKKILNYVATETKLKAEAAANQKIYNEKVYSLVTGNDYNSPDVETRRKWVDNAEDIFKTRAENPYYELSDENLLKLMHRSCENDQVCPHRTPFTHQQKEAFINIAKGSLAAVINSSDRDADLSRKDVTIEHTDGLTKEQAARVVEETRIRVSNATNTPEWKESGRPRIRDFNINDPKAIEKYRDQMEEISAAVTFHRSNVEGVRMRNAVAEVTNGAITDFDINNPDTYKKYGNRLAEINEALAVAGKRTVEDQLEDKKQQREDGVTPSPYEQAELKKAEEKAIEALPAETETPKPATKCSGEECEKEQAKIKQEMLAPSIKPNEIPHNKPDPALSQGHMV